MFPLLNNRFLLLKQYGLSCMYPIYKSKKSDLLSSSSYEYDRVNKTASEILSLCDGSNDIDDIAMKLSKNYSNGLLEIKHFVTNFIAEAKNKDYIKIIDEKAKKTINVAGSFNTIYPFFVTFEITKKCPLKCKHCYNDSGLIKRKELSTKQIIDVLYKLKNIGVQKIMLTGGEPTTNADFPKILDIATQLFIGVSIGSCGYYIDEAFINRIKHLNRNMVFQISVDGLEKSHDLTRGVKGSFNKAINAISLLSVSGINVIVANTLNKYNIDDIEKVTKLVKSKGARQITYSSTLEVGRAKSNKLNEGIDINKFDSIVKNMRELFTDKHFVISNSPTKNKCEDEINNISCGAGDTQACIRENGDVSPCTHFIHSYGNIYLENPEDVFDKTRVSRFRDVIKPSKNECSNCLKCIGCIAYSTQMTDEDCIWRRNQKTFCKEIEFLHNNYL